MLNDELKTVISVFTGLLVLLLGFAVAATGPGLIRHHQRYATFLESQRTVLECRANVASGRDVEDICGSIPTLEGFK